MNGRIQRTVIVLGLTLLQVRPANGGPPPNPTPSDATHNTAGGANVLSNNTGIDNTAFGDSTLHTNTTGNDNTAAGAFSLFANTTGAGNTATGAFSLTTNTTGISNTATGAFSLFANTTGAGNTATGYSALVSNTIGYANTAVGSTALGSNVTGADNTAAGYAALVSNTTGSNNTAAGVNALVSNTTGSHNTATGFNALRANTTGEYNLAAGQQALFANVTGSYNTSVGWGALAAQTAGVGNIAVGWGAGASLLAGGQNIYLGHPGFPVEAKTLRLGSIQTRTFVAGVTSTPVTGNTVLINANGQLGTLVSSARYKRDIQPLGDQQQKLEQLRPVTFHYKQEPNGPLQYGLIAEEVAQIYPELVTRDATGKIAGVRYEELTPILLHELQLQHQQWQAVMQQLAELRAQNESLRTAVAEIQNRGEQSVAAATEASRER